NDGRLPGVQRPPGHRRGARGIHSRRADAVGESSLTGIAAHQNMIWTSAETALAHLRSGMRVFIGSGCAAPQKLVAALAARGPEIYDVEIIHILTHGVAPYARRELLSHFRHNA